MHVQSLQIENFRRFAKLECEFDPQLTLLMGVNGAGKSSLLKAIALPISNALLLGGWIGSLPFERTDVRSIYSEDPSHESWKNVCFPASLTVGLGIGESRAALRIEHSPLGAQMHQSGSFSNEWAQGLQLFLGQTSRWFSSENSAPIPLLARFGVSNPQSGDLQTVAVRPFDEKKQLWERFVDDGIDVARLAQWFQYHEYRSLQEGKEPLVFRAAKDAVISATHAQDIKFVVRENRLMLHFAADGWRPFDELSDGQRRLAGLFMEIAVRASSLNSHLGDRCVAETPGLVLIDELDMHLHPKWQRSVIDDLLAAFPKLQFIVASHSPFLIQSALERGIVIDASTGGQVDSMDHSIEDIAETVMGVEQPQRSRRFLEKRRLAQDYLELMETPTSTPEEREALKLQLDEALADFADDPAAAAWLKMQSVSKGF